MTDSGRRLLRVLLRSRRWQERRMRKAFISPEPLNEAQMARALERSKAENWKDIVP